MAFFAVALLAPSLAGATTPHPRLLWKAEDSTDYDLEQAVEMVDDGTSGDAVAGDGLFTAEVVFFPDDPPSGPRTFHYTVVPPNQPVSEAIGGTLGSELSVVFPDNAERTVRFFYSTARAPEIPSTPACPDVETRLSCLGFGPIPGVSDDWNTSGQAWVVGDHQTVLGAAAWNVSSAVAPLHDGGAAGASPRRFSFLGGSTWSDPDGWQVALEPEGGHLILGHGGWHRANEGAGEPFGLSAEPWRVVRFEFLPDRGMARQTVDPGPTPKPLITEVVTDGTASFVEIHNPAASPLALAGLHLTNHPGYPSLGGSPTAVNEAGFIVRFPAGRALAPLGWLTVSLANASAFQSAWGALPDYVLPNLTGATAMQAAHASPSAVGAAPALPESGAFVGLIHLAHSEERVRDVDLVTWGAPDASRALPNKTGIAVGSESYGEDSMRAAAMPAPAGQFMARRDFSEGGQRTGSTYNGLPSLGSSRMDETDEPLSSTWALAGSATPGEAPGDFRFTVGGVVTDSGSGDPVSGAVVAASPGGPSTTTAEDGTYSLELPAGSWSLEVTAEGYQPRTRGVSVDGAVEVDIELDREPGVFVAGRVRDDLGRWLAGVRVDLAGGQRTRNTTTATDGSFNFSGVQPNTLYTITASMAGHQSASRDLNIRQSDVFDVILTLIYVPVAHAVSGTVVDSISGTGLTGALVSMPALEASTITGQGGVFTFRLVPPGTYAIDVRAEGYANQRVEITVSEDDLEDVEIRMSRDGGSITLTGTVTMASLGLPVAGAIVRLAGPEETPREATTNTRGAYVMMGLAPGGYELTVLAGGYEPHHELIELDVSTEHNILLETPPGHGFGLSGTVRIEGKSTGELAGTTVAISTEGEPDDAMAVQRTNADGYYRFEDLSPGRYRLVASRPGFVSAGLTIVVAGDTVQHFILHPDPADEGEGILSCALTRGPARPAWIALLLWLWAARSLTLRRKSLPLEEG